MKKIVKYLLCLFLLMSAKGALAQQVEMADAMRSEGKIYVVVAIILVVLTGLILYLFLQDRKLTKLEKIIQAKDQTK